MLLGALSVAVWQGCLCVSGVSSFCLVPPAQQSQVQYHPPRWCRGHVALGTEHPEHPSRVSTAWIRSWVLLLLNRVAAHGGAHGDGDSRNSQFPPSLRV